MISGLIPHESNDDLSDLKKALSNINNIIIDGPFKMDGDKTIPCGMSCTEYFTINAGIIK